MNVPNEDQVSIIFFEIKFPYWNCASSFTHHPNIYCIEM